ncbi:hypothetical protein K501DRAFT_257137 [Backusella circina FSU 941]|nr:hypothetical protein K501DRAFT_257137 [Backusella circina FSU 941]
MGDTGTTTTTTTITVTQNQASTSKPLNKSTNTNKRLNRHPKKPTTQHPQAEKSNESSSNAIRSFKNRAQSRLTTSNDENNTQDKVDTKTKPKKKRNRHPPLKDDLSSILAHELRTSSYECMICMDVVRPAHHVWTCDCCWAVFHLNCVHQWANKSLKDTSSQKLITQWRCPGCQHTRTAIPRDYVCFCGKQRNPDPSRYSTPHSCEQLCKKHKSCPHPCVLPCHPGPCPPCSLMGPETTCYCGQSTKQSRCSDTDYHSKGYSCERPCTVQLGCGKHQCNAQCHKGLCSPCEVEEIQSCYCGRHERTARCGTGKQVQLRGHTGYYSCNEICDSVYKCGIHACKKSCHPCDTNTKDCPFDPSIITTCPCGTHAIDQLLEGGRTKCTDAIPTCESVCNKRLSCGHACTKACHLGDCPPCWESVKVPCRCQSSTFTKTCANVCEAAGGEPPLCDRVCKSIRNCGQHACGNVCCPAAKANGKRREGTEHVHDCPETCNKTLSCGNHQCKAKCHKGKCQPCLEATFDELACHCGRTQLEPPIRCGTKVPVCHFPCVRLNPCGHVRFLQHNCHPDDETCPPCPVLVSRSCLCGKIELKNVPCYRESPRCGSPCGKSLPCGIHVCLKTCHGGPCLTSEEACLQVCGSTKGCGHPCQDKCHGASDCPEATPCTARIRAQCPCGQNTMVIPCHATFASSGSNQELECNAFCAKVLRNKNLALALDIKRDGPSPPTAGYYDTSLCEFYLENPGWCKQMEETLVRFSKDDNTKVFYFKPMRSQFRRFLHRYAIHFNLATEAVDAEPARSVVMRKTLGDTRIPSLLLSKTARNPALNKAPVEQARAVPKHPINALYLTNIVAGLSKLALEAALAPVMKLGEDNIPFVSAWIDENDAVITPLISECVSMDEKEMIICQLKRLVKSALEDTTIDRVDFCWISQKGKVLWTEKKHLPQEQQKQKTKHVSNKFNALSDHHSSSDSGSDHNDDDDDWFSVGQINPYKPVATKPRNEDAWKEPPAEANLGPVQTSPTAEDNNKKSHSLSAMTADDWEDLA